MEQSQFLSEQRGAAKRSVESRWNAWLIAPLLLLSVPSTPASLEAMGEYLSCHECTYDTVSLNCPGR